MDFKSFKDLVVVREMHENYLETAKSQLEYYKKLLHKDAPRDIQESNFDGLPHGNSNAMSFERILMYMQKYESMIEHETWTIENLRRLEAEQLDKVKQMEGIGAKVVYLRDIMGMQLQEIADELGYDVGYIKNISSKNKKCDF